MAVKIVVSPSAEAIVSKDNELSIKYWSFIGGNVPLLPLLTDDIVTGSSGEELGTIAKLIAPFAYGPLIPGPDKKNPKTSR